MQEFVFCFYVNVLTEKVLSGEARQRGSWGGSTLPIVSYCNDVMGSFFKGLK